MQSSSNLSSISSSSQMTSEGSDSVYRVIAIEEDYKKGKKIVAQVHLVGTSKVFRAFIHDLYHPKWFSKFSREDVAYIGFLYAAEIEQNYGIIPQFPKEKFGHSNSILIIGILYSTFLVLSNFSATKISHIFFGDLASGIIFFPLTYIFDDILTEVYGFKQSRRVIWAGFLANIVCVIGIQIVIAMPPSSFWDNQEAFASVFRLSPRIFVASMLSYLVGEFINSIVLSKLKILTSGKYLGLRYVGSTICGVGIENTLFCFLAFYLILPTEVIGKMILIQLLLKVGYEILVLPITYKITNYLKSKDKIDHYDFNTQFNPFSLRLD